MRTRYYLSLPDPSKSRGHGDYAFTAQGAGAFADSYTALGGEVLEIGKPDPMVYETVLATLGLPPARIAAIGDTPHTDLAGAAAVGIDAIWALTGLAGDHFGPNPTPEALAAEAAREGVSPRAALRSLRW